MTQVLRVFYPCLVYLLTMLPRSLLPVGDGAFIEAEGGHEGGQRTAKSQQGDHQEDGLLVGLQTVEGRALASRESAVAD